MSSDGAAESKTGGAADAPGGSEAGSADEERRAYPAADVRELVGQVESLVAMWRKACDSGGEALTALANAAITGGYFNDRQLPTLPPALLEDLASHSLRKVDEHADALRSCFEDVAIASLQRMGPFESPSDPTDRLVARLSPARVDSLTQEVEQQYSQDLAVKAVIMKRAPLLTEADTLTVFASTWQMQPHIQVHRVTEIIAILKGATR